MDRNELTKHDIRFHESLFKRIINQFLVGLLIAVSWLPFWLLYRFSDVLYIFIRFVLKYRYKVITENLKNAFPEKMENEISQIRNKFYRHICDVIFESIKMYSISNNEFDKRIQSRGLEAVNKLYDEGKSIICLTMHYNNWEWTGFLQSKLKHLVLPVYNPIRGNNAMEKFLIHNREKWGSQSIPVHKTARSLLEYNIKKQLTILWLVADQTPPANSKFWTYFLNRETPFFSGPEKIASSTNQPVFFQHTKKIGRGRYLFEIIALCEKPNEMDPKDIFLAYVRKCEEIIRQEPEYYLWSHRRWKHKRPEDIPLTL